MRASLTSIALLAAACSMTSAHGPDRAAPVADGIDAEVIGPRGVALDSYLSRASRFGFTGTMLVADTGGIVLHKGYGWADQAGTIPLRTTSVFDMGSITKQFTAAAILLLQHEGLLSVRDSLPQYFAHVPSDKRGITIHQLLTHTGGINDGLVGDYDPVGRDSLVQEALAAPLVSVPGVGFNYSNTGFSMLAAIVELITGRSWEQFVRDRLLLPAGMQHTGYDLPSWNPADVAHTFTPPLDQGSPLDRWRTNPGPHWGLMGNGGMLTTTGDLYRWELALKRGVPVPVDVQRIQFSPRFARTPTLSHGYDWWLEQIDGELVMHRGSDCPPCGLNGEYRRYSDGGTAIFMANSRHNGGSTRRFVMSRLRRLQRGTAVPNVPVVTGAPRPALERVAGTFRLDSDSASTIAVAVEGDHLALTARGQAATELLTFNRDTTAIAARRAANARAAELIAAVAQGSVQRIHALWPGEARAARLIQLWNESATNRGALTGVAILGTTRTDRGALLTTAELEFGGRPVAIRFAWAGTQPTTNSEDQFLDRFAAFMRYSPVAGGAWSPYWWLDGESILTHDLLSGADLRATLTRAASRCVSALSFEIGASRVRAERVGGC